MTQDRPPLSPHPSGEDLTAPTGGVKLESFSGPIEVEWDARASSTPLGQLPFFIEFLKVSGLFDAFVADCPLDYTSPNAAQCRDVFGTAMLAILSGHKRYAHIAALRGDGVLPELLNMKKIVSEDAVRRGGSAIDEDRGADWLRRHLDACTTGLLSEPWILDIDTTVKPLYGHQEGAVNGYNPKKPGRPSHSYHTYSMAGTRLVLDVDVAPGDETSSKHFAPGLWAFLDRLPRDLWPSVLRGDKGFGNEPIMREAGQRSLAYIFKLRQTANVKRLITRVSRQNEWAHSGHGWQVTSSQIRLEGWSRQRQIIVLRRRIRSDLATEKGDANGHKQLSFMEIAGGSELYEYCVLVTNLDEDETVFGQLYRDRGDSENIFDELKNQWGWGGFVTHDLARCRLAARLVALIYNWWNVFARLAAPTRHMEAITSRPLLIHAIAIRAKHARKTTITITSSHAKAALAEKAMRRVSAFLHSLLNAAEQLSGAEKWRTILSRAYKIFLQGRNIRPPPRLQPQF